MMFLIGQLAIYMFMRSEEMLYYDWHYFTYGKQASCFGDNIFRKASKYDKYIISILYIIYGLIFPERVWYPWAVNDILSIKYRNIRWGLSGCPGEEDFVCVRANQAPVSTSRLEEEVYVDMVRTTSNLQAIRHFLTWMTRSNKIPVSSWIRITYVHWKKWHSSPVQSLALKFFSIRN